MASAVKKRKLDEPVIDNQLVQQEKALCPELPLELWRVIANLLPLTEIDLFTLLNKKLSVIPSSFPIELRIFSGIKKGTARSSTQNPQIVETPDRSRIVKWLKEKNRVRTITMIWNSTFFNDDILPLVENPSCKYLKVIRNLNYTDQNEAKLECNALIATASRLILDKKQLQKFSIQCSNTTVTAADFTFSSLMLGHLLYQLKELPIKDLELDFDTPIQATSEVLGPQLRRFKKLKHLSISQELDTRFWEALTLFSKIKSLDFGMCKLSVDAQQNEALVSNAFASFSQLKTLRINPQLGSNILKYCISGFLKSIPTKLNKLIFTILDSTDLSKFNVTEEARNAFFKKIADPDSSVTSLTVADPILFDYIKNAPWKVVYTRILAKNLNKIALLRDRKEPLILHLHCYDATLQKIRDEIMQLFPKSVVGKIQIRLGKIYQALSLNDGKITLTIYAKKS